MEILIFMKMIKFLKNLIYMILKKLIMSKKKKCFFQWDMLIILNVIKILFVFLLIMDVMLLKLIINKYNIYN